MPEPEADVTAVPSTATETEAAAETTEAAATPAEASNTETTAAETKKDEDRPDLSYTRFVEINKKRKEADAQVEDLKRELEAARSAQRAKPAAPATELSEPPEGLSKREQVDFYVQQGVQKFFEEKLEMDAPQVASLLKAIPSVSDATYEQQWVRMCEAKGIDPTDRRVVDLTKGLVQSSGHAPQDALDMVADLIGQKKAATTTTTPQQMEHDATTGSMTSTGVGIVFDRAKARALAENGKRVDLADAVDILRAASEKRKAAG